MAVVLGLDLGANSLGWALIDDENKHIIDMGSRVFEEGVQNMNSKQEQSKNAQRRDARAIRRQNYRRKRRKNNLKRFLIENDMMPVNPDEKYFSDNPYLLRKKALYEKLTLHELGIVLYHLNQRRGYKSNRKEALDDNEKGAIFEGKKDSGQRGISELKQALIDGSFKTIGEYFSTLNPHEIRIRNRYTERSMYIEEFENIWESQSRYYPDIFTKDNYQLLKNKIIFFQRPLKSQKGKVGKCIFEKNKRRAPICSFTAQEFRMLQQLNSITIFGRNRVEPSQQELTINEREIILDALHNNAELKFEKFRKLLKLDSDYKINMEHQGKIDGLKSKVALKKVLGKLYDNYSEEQIYRMWHTLYFAENHEFLKRYAQKEWGLIGDVLDKFCKIKLEQGYLSLSTKAINKMLPLMREGKMYHEACLDAGYAHSLWDKEIQKADILPPAPWVANPIVNVAMGQLRIVVNEIIKHYGTPDQIKVEMARDLKNNLKDRMDTLQKNKKQKQYHDDIKEVLKTELNMDKPSRNDIIKYKLWKEAKETCLYTGKKIALHQLFNGEVDIEHILPYSRTLDSSFGNLSICYREENARKGNKTPFEAYGSDEKAFALLKERIKTLPINKANRFTLKEINLDEFIQRKLNDTRYISRLSLEYLKVICEDVSVSNGQTTAILRRFWGLNNLLNEDEEDKRKNREDHRHHAIDALIIGFTTRSVLKRLSTYHRIHGELDDGLSTVFPAPWEKFRNSVKSAIANIIVSHRFNPKVRGQLHEETLYGRLKDINGEYRTNEKGVNLYVVRKPLKNLTANEITNIIDQDIKDTVFERLVEHGVNTSAKKLEIPKNAFAEPLYLRGHKSGTLTQIKSVRVYKPASNMRRLRNYNIYVEPGNNHHIELYADENGGIHGEVVSLYDCYKRKTQGKSVINKDHGPGNDFLYSLQINENIISGEIPEEFNINDKSTYQFIFNKVYRVQKMTYKGDMIFRQHWTSITADIDNIGVLRRSPSTIFASKIKVNATGFIEMTYD